MADQGSLELIKGLDLATHRGAKWLTDRLESSGKPVGADERNSWWRTPWTLTLAGERSAAAAVMSWVEREALDDEGDLRPGPARGAVPVTPVYALSHLAIAASLLNRFDTAELLLRRLRHFQHPQMGGAYFYRDDPRGQQDFLFTTQVGLAGIIGGHLEMADAAYRWLGQIWAAQPALSESRFYNMLATDGLVTEFSEAETWIKVADYRKPRQAFYNPGAAAAFLADFALRTGDAAPIGLARDIMQLNIKGCEEQFTDLGSVQICKFGWGAGQLLLADPGGGWLPHVVRMAQWFIDRQQADGAWLPSVFTLQGPASDNDKMWKTAEHVMETAMMSAALAGHGHRQAASSRDPASVQEFRRAV